MACEVNNKEINSQCAELLVRPSYIIIIKNTFRKLSKSIVHSAILPDIVLAHKFNDHNTESFYLISYVLVLYLRCK